MSLASDTASAAPARLRLGQIAAVTAGNGLEFYDFLIYSNFAIYIGRAYFPVHGEVASLLLSLATFGIGFATRPLGSVVLGRLGDRIGRKPAMMASFGLMALGLLGLAVTPSYARIGVAAPILAVIWRLVQGFALGGEVGPSTAYLVEAAPLHRRGLIGGLQTFSQGLAILVASTIAVLLARALPAQALADWGWRAAFLAGLVIVPFGLWMRRGLVETRPEPARVPVAGTPRRPVPWGLVGLSVMLVGCGTINTYVNTYMVTYAMDTLHLRAGTSFGAGVAVGVSAVVAAPLAGWLSDRLGRRAVMAPAVVALIVLPAPAFGLLIAYPSAASLYAATAVLTFATAMATAVMLVAITESLPARLRCLAVGLAYAGAVAVFGGTTQLAVGWLLHALHQPLAPAWYRMVASAVGLLAVLLLPESAPSKVRQLPAAATALGTA